MLPFQIAEAFRRARRGRRQPPRRDGDPSTWRLLADEVSHLVRTHAWSPAAIAGLLGVIAAVGVHVALGPAYPGPVAPDVARWLLLGLVVAASFGLGRTLPARWQDVRRAVGGVRVGLVLVASAAAFSVVKVGLHEMTPGPVIPAPARWVAIGAAVVVAIWSVAGHDHRPDS